MCVLIGKRVEGESLGGPILLGEYYDIIVSKAILGEPMPLYPDTISIGYGGNYPNHPDRGES